MNENGAEMRSEPHIHLRSQQGQLKRETLPAKFITDHHGGSCPLPQALQICSDLVSDKSSKKILKENLITT
ncbi:hypothetical protein RRG08_020946 [Elysia crispata]|uniref:Uncharacterized protein n=1 Tax=Elysia crispata TaxID=231223 RepID=A0AAE1EET3_9GAST|nr:hypothetical protein RRG08_020946 [Elysia crispata]